MNEIRTLVTGRGLVESPRWHGDRLYFSDWSAGEVLAVDLAGDSEVIARVKSLPLCTAWLPDGRLVIVSSPDGRLLRREPDGTLVTHADLGRSGWNDIVVDGRGNAYVNRVGFDTMAGEEFTAGFRRISATPDGSVRQVADDIAFPNGMAVTADNSTLIVADSYGHSSWRSTSAPTAGSQTGGSGPTSATVPRTASASTRRTPSGTPTCPTSGACASPRAARCCRPLNWTAAASPAPSAAPTGRRCSSWPPNGGA